MKKLVFLSLAILACISFADTNTQVKAKSKPTFIVYEHAGTGRLVDLPPAGQTNYLDHGAVAILSDGTIIEVDPSRINSPKLSEPIWVKIGNKELSCPRPGPGQTRRLHSAGHTYSIDHNGKVTQLPDKTVPIGGMSIGSRSQLKSQEAPRVPRTNSLERLPTRRLNGLLEIYKLSAPTNAVAAEKVKKIEAILDARTNSLQKASDVVRSESRGKAMEVPADATFGEPDPPDMDHAYYHGNTRPPLPGEADRRVRRRRRPQ